MIALLLALALTQQETIKADKDCMGCHAKQTDAWKTSVHAKHDTTCISCHKESVIDRSITTGNPHLKKAPFISGMKNRSQDVCVQCHEKVTEEFKKGPHWDEDISANAKWTAKKRQGCLSCHEFHSTAPAVRSAIIAERCSHCHKENSSQRKIWTAYTASADPFDEELAALRKFLEHPLPGVPYDKAETARDTAQGLYKSLRVEQHNCKFDELGTKIPPALAALKKDSGELQQQYAAAKTSRRNYFLGFLGLMVVNLFLLRAWCVKKYKH